MRQFNLAEETYLLQNRNLAVNALAKALMTTEEHVTIELAKLPAKRGRGRPKKAVAPVVESPKPVTQPETPVEAPAMATMARVKGRGAIAMTGAASEIADVLSGLKVG